MSLIYGYICILQHVSWDGYIVSDRYNISIWIKNNILLTSGTKKSFQVFFKHI